MHKIIDINEDTVSIGMKNGDLILVKKFELKFEPRIGDIVEVYQNKENRSIVLSNDNIKSLENGINININNDNTNINSNISGVYVNKLIYCLLAFFIGGIGAHKFYAGKIMTGFLYIFFCWTFIPMIVSLIECLIAFMKKEDSNGNILV